MGGSKGGKLHPKQSALSEPLLPIDKQDAEWSLRTKMLLVITFGLGSSLFISEALLLYILPDAGATYLCTFSKLSLLHMNIARFQFGDVAGYIVITVLLALLVSIV